VRRGGITTHTFRTSVQIKLSDLASPHLILVGLPGAGKTTVGRLVADKLGRSFLDFDEEIEKREAMPIAQIFAAKGEHHFRSLEKKLTVELAKTSGMIVAPGGGWITQPEVVALVCPPARMIYLKLRPETALARLGVQRATRPLLIQPDPLGALKSLLAARAAAYEKADVTINSELLSQQAVVDAVLKVAAENSVP
jgi:shikimate kinase